MDLKLAAAETAITFVKTGTSVGLGAGNTIAFMVDLLAAQVKQGLEIKVCTSSFTTWQLLSGKGFIVQPIASISGLDIYLDSCDQLDKDLNALKSGGGIHTREKLLASMAGQFVLVGDETKYVDHFTTKFPLVIELLPEAFSYVPACLQKQFSGIKSMIRMSNNKDGAVITENGNYLLDTWFTDWPELSVLNGTVKGITGVVETSLFYKLAHKAVIAGKNGTAVLERR